MKVKVTLIVGLSMIGVGIWLLTRPDIEWKLLGGTLVALGVWYLADAYRVWRRSRWRPEAKLEGVIASHLTGWHRIDLTDEGVRTKDRYIPYRSIVDCSLWRSDRHIDTACIIRHSDDRGRIIETRLKKERSLGGLSIFSDIIRISRQHGYKVAQRPNEEMAYLASRLRAIDVESEFLEPDVQHNRVSQTEDSGSWHMEHGGLMLKHSNINYIGVNEDGILSTTPGYAGPSGGSPSSVNIGQQYHIDCKIQIDTAADVVSSGKPHRKGVLKRVVDYDWAGGNLAKRLNEDTQLREMLVKAKAPAIEVRGDHIRIEDKKFLTPKLFQCLDRIAGRVRQQASQ